MADKVDKLLQEVGAVFIRQRKHLIYRLPNGHIFVRASTTAYHFEVEDSYRSLRRALGLKDEDAGKQGDRRPRKPKFGRKESSVEPWKRSVNTGLADKLREAGVVELAMDARIEYLEEQNGLLSEMVAEECACSRVRNFIRKIWPR